MFCGLLQVFLLLWKSWFMSSQTSNGKTNREVFSRFVLPLCLWNIWKKINGFMTLKFQTEKFKNNVAYRGMSRTLTYVIGRIWQSTLKRGLIILFYLFFLVEVDSWKLGKFEEWVAGFFDGRFEAFFLEVANVVWDVALSTLL